MAVPLTRVAYKPGWSVGVGGPGGRYLCVMARTFDSTDHSKWRLTQHMFEIPVGLEPYTREWQRWVFARLLDAEWHEAAEFFRVDGTAPFYPHHQDEGSPYARVERW